MIKRLLKRIKITLFYRQFIDGYPVDSSSNEKLIQELFIAMSCRKTTYDEWDTNTKHHQLDDFVEFLKEADAYMVEYDRIVFFESEDAVTCQLRFF